MPGTAQRRFAPSAASTLLMVAAVAACVALGRWQLGRADQKRALFEGFAAGDAPALPLPASFEPVERYRRVTAHGAYDPRRQLLLDNMTDQGRPGFQVLTPLLLNDGRILLVNRGWVPLGPTRGALPDLAVDAAPRQVSGRMDRIPRPPIDLIAPPPGDWPRVANFPRMEMLADWYGRDLHPQVLLLDAGEPDGFRRAWQPPGLPPERHFGYAVQWFTLGATALGAWLVLGLRREPAP